MMKDIKKKIVTTSLGAMVLASGLTGCNSNTKQASNDEKSNITTEATTLEHETEEATLSPEEAQLESNREQYKEVALNSYETYQEFYDDINVTPSDIEKLVKILDEDFEGITPDDIRSSYALIDQMIFSNNMHYQIDKHIFKKDEDTLKIYDQPRVSELVSNDNETIKEFLIRTENLRDEVYSAYATGSKEDRKNAMEDAAKLVDAEAISYRKGNAIIDDDYLSSSKKLLVSNYEKNIIAILNSVSANQPEMESSEGFTIYLISNVSVRVDKDGNKVYDYTGTDDVAFADGKELRKLLAQSEQGKYIETECSEVALLIKKVQENNMSQKSEAKDTNKTELKSELLKKKQILSMVEAAMNNQNEESKSYSYRA